MSNDFEHQPTAYPNRALIDLQFEKSSARFELQVTPAGLIAVGFLVSGILLSAATIVTAASRNFRQN